MASPLPSATIRTHGLSHVSLMVRDPDTSARFYAEVFGTREYFRDTESVQLLGPGPNDVLAFVRASGAVRRGAIDHIGFRLVAPEDIVGAAERIRQAGGTVVREGVFAPGLPFLYALDPDGHELEIWYE